MKLAEWIMTIDKCPHCGYNRFTKTEDGLQCFECNNIIYYPADLEMDTIRCVKPMDWKYMRAEDRHHWYNNHQEAMLEDYSVMTRKGFLTKWGISDSVWHYLRKRWGVIPAKEKGVRAKTADPVTKKPKKVKQASKHKAVPQEVPPEERQLPFDLTITLDDLKKITEDDYWKVWFAIGVIVRRRLEGVLT